MKKNIAAVLLLTLCLLLFTACKDKNEELGSDYVPEVATVDEATVPAEKFRAEEDFTGTYVNDVYTAYIAKTANDELAVIITSAVQNGQGSEWTMSGYLSDINYKVNYDNAVKAVISYNSEGDEISRNTEYVDGSGKIVFDDNNGFTWINSMENIENNIFTKTK